MKRHRVLVVDDSRSMQALIAQALSAAHDIEVIGFASDAFEAREAIKRLDPDVITLDVEMPRMSGVEFLEKLMRLRPTPVVMVSSLTTANADATMEALSKGAITCIPKPLPGQGANFDGLIDAVRDASGIEFRTLSTTASERARPEAHADYRSDGRVVAIGSSAGGIEALSSTLKGLPATSPPIVITQHMPANFTTSLAARLDRLCDAHVVEATDGAVLEPGKIYIAPGGLMHLEVTGTPTSLRCRLRPGEPVTGHRPSVDVLFSSVAKTAGDRAVGVILSGMGRDGTAGLLQLRKAGAATIGQDQATSFIYGMPRSAFEAGAVQKQLPVQKIGEAILAATKSNSRKETL